MADAARMAQVFVHLFVHAARSFTSADHDANRVALRAKFDGIHVVVEVSSNAPAIPAEIARRVFDPFFSTSHVGGLGLSFSEHEIVALGGQLLVETNADQETTFRVKLPAISRPE